MELKSLFKWIVCLINGLHLRQLRKTAWPIRRFVVHECETQPPNNVKHSKWRMILWHSIFASTRLTKNKKIKKQGKWGFLECLEACAISIFRLIVIDPSFPLPKPPFYIEKKKIKTIFFSYMYLREEKGEEEEEDEVVCWVCFCFFDVL